VLAAFRVIQHHRARDFSGEGRARPGAHHVVRDVARKGFIGPCVLLMACIPEDQVVDEDDGPGGRGRLGRSYLCGIQI
jgi:hypothetical protein